MKSNYLFPVIFRKIGWWLFVPSLLLGVYYLFGNDTCIDVGGSKALALFDGMSETSFLTIATNYSWTDELIIICLTVSMLFIAFSREKDEDECIANIRMQSLVWAIMVNSSLLIVATMLVFGLPYLTFMSIYMFSFLLLFIVKYQWTIYQFRRTVYDK